MICILLITPRKPVKVSGFFIGTWFEETQKSIASGSN